jgi:hypothetical protein
MGDPSIPEACDSEPGDGEPVVIDDDLVVSRVVSANTRSYLDRSAGERADAIAQLSALLAATHAELLDVICAADVAGDWVDDGATGPVPWLVGHNALASGTAREWLRVADALQDLPALRDRYATGAMSWDQIRAATKFASSVDDDDLAERLPGCPRTRSG